MKQLLSILELSNKIFKVRKFYNMKRYEYFLKYHWSDITKELEGTYNPSNWISTTSILNDRAVLGMLKRIFFDTEYYPNSKDLAVAMNFACFGYCNESITDNSKILDLSYATLIRVKERIIGDGILSDWLKESNKKIDLINNSIPREEIEEIFVDKKTLFRYYYESFEDKRFSSKMTIYHQDYDKSWIDWKEENSFTISVDPTRIREGFHQLGFDYHLDGQPLRIASLVDGYEYFNKKIGDTCVWLA